MRVRRCTRNRCAGVQCARAHALAADQSESALLALRGFPSCRARGGDSSASQTGPKRWRCPWGSSWLHSGACCSFQRWYTARFGARQPAKSRRIAASSINTALKALIWLRATERSRFGFTQAVSSALRRVISWSWLLFRMLSYQTERVSFKRSRKTKQNFQN